MHRSFFITWSCTMQVRVQIPYIQKAAAKKINLNRVRWAEEIR